MAVPIGPNGILCIRKTLTEGRLHGLIIGLGAAIADLFYVSVVAFGLTVSNLCRKYGLSQAVYYKWRDKFLDGGKRD